MEYDFEISGGAYTVVSTLQEAGFETYIVGGAIRDLLLARKPKDFDISTSATPEEVRQVFGRRHARIIGKRFRLTHVTIGKELFEVSTFRRAPSAHAGKRMEEKFQKMPDNMIVSDNDYGTSVEDAFRRDFTVNALFYDPVKRELHDHTGLGLKDIQEKRVRAIGDAALRFEEDPVRMLRALKLVAQFDFSMDDVTENALFSSLPFFCHASPGRLSLELEKILKSSHSDRHFEVFFDYGLLSYFMPELSAKWGSDARKRAIDLLYERNCRIDSGIYRDSISLGLAALALPFIAEKLGDPAQVLWNRRDENIQLVINETLREIIAPQVLMVKVRESAVRTLFMLSILEHASDKDIISFMQHKSYSHGRELLILHHLTQGEDTAALEQRFPRGKDPRESYGNFPGSRRNNGDKKNDGPSRRRRPRRRGRKPEVKPDFEE